MSKEDKSKAQKQRKKTQGTQKRAVPKETTGKAPEDKRRSPRYPRNRVWSNATRERHRDERDQAIEDAGLVTDRMVEKGQKPKDSD